MESFTVNSQEVILSTNERCLTLSSDILYGLAKIDCSGFLKFESNPVVDAGEAETYVCNNSAHLENGNNSKHFLFPRTM